MGLSASASISHVLRKLNNIFTFFACAGLLRTCGGWLEGPWALCDPLFFRPSMHLCMQQSHETCSRLNLFVLPEGEWIAGLQVRRTTRQIRQFFFNLLLQLAGGVTCPYRQPYMI
ncbi:hypothetical protein N431DRAFT_205166 [Stipitochalara longipes BDJ]|nr:hypothetical protein N431DRAFT_205166 [Stipitochalara longipes BDJ]